ncbi:MAG: TolC family protein [Prevotella sp.]
MNKNRILSVGAGLVLSVLTASAQLTLEECQRLAAEHYPLVKRYQLIEQTAGYTLANISKGWLPQLSFDAQATLQSDVMTLPDALETMLAGTGQNVKGLKKDQYRVGLNVSQVVYDGGSIKASRKSAMAESDVEVKKNEVELYQLRERVNNLFFGVLLTEEKIRLNENLQELLLDNCRKMEAMVKGGTAMRSDQDAIRSEYLNARQQHTELSATKNCFLRMLEAFIGRRVSSGLEKPKADAPLDDTPDRPELRWMDAQTRLIDAKEKQLDASLRPSLSLFAQGYYGYPGYDMFGDMFSHDWTLNGMVGLKLSWNLSSFYTHKNDRRRLSVQRAEVENAREVFLFNNRLQSIENHSTIRRYQLVMAEDEEIISLRSSVRQATEEKLSHGVIDVNDLLQEINRENNARIALSTHEIEMLKSIYELKYTLNK